MNWIITFLLRFHKVGYVLVVTSGFFFASCKKDTFITSAAARISTSVDSLKYDTVFTSIGSVTKSFKISNLNKQRLLLTRIKLMGGAASSFKINVNGIAADEVAGIEVAAEDSLYVFVTVNINPNAIHLPFVVRDSIEIFYNGNSRFVQLEAFGQNANFLRNKVLTGNVIWTNNLPYVILGSLVVDTAASLTIDPGCKIYSHADAPVIIDGTLIVNGTSAERVSFSGDRLDDDYKDFPASWPGIYFRGSSKNNSLKYATIRNAYQAVVAEKPSVNSNPKISLQQCIIDNAYDAGVLCVNSSLLAENSLITNCGKNVSLIYGGDYTMTHCTIASYPVFFSHKNPVLEVANHATLMGSILTADLNAVFRNCIFWADTSAINTEVNVSKQGSTNFNVSFDHCLYKGSDPANSTLTAVIRNQDPQFDSIDVSKRYFDFRVTKNNTAPGLNQGLITGLATDLDGKNRNVGIPDLGCFEKQ